MLKIMDEIKLTVHDICKIITSDKYILGSQERCITEFKGLSLAGPDSLSFYSGIKDLSIIRKSGAGVIICIPGFSFEYNDYIDKTLILVNNPRLAFIEVMNKVLQKVYKPSISSSASIDNDAIISPTAYIGPNTFIGGKCNIGDNVIIHSGAVAGKDGFGYERNGKGELIKFPHIGGVIIENDVEIGANTCIDRGTLGNTVIGEGTKIDNMCHISHNVIIGKHCLIIAHCVICGGCIIGDYSMIAPGAIIRDNVTVGNDVIVGMGTVVTKNIENNSVVYGVPGKIEAQHKQ